MSGQVADPTRSVASIGRLGEVLRGRQADLVRPGPDALVIEQVGGVVLDQPFLVPVPGPDDAVTPRGVDAVIETFVIETDGQVAATGTAPAVAAWWKPMVEALVDRVTAALAPAGVELHGPIYVTASATPIEQVIAEPHLDDDQYAPGAGVGLVAIAASHAGPRLARGLLGCRRAMPGAPLDLDRAELADWFDAADGPSPDRGQATPGEHIVLFPRFGQLHAGPVLDGDVGDGGTRNLLVLRADTVPVQARTGSGPT